MNRASCLCVALMLFANTARASDAPDYANLAAGAKALAARSHESLGIGIRALSLLLEADSRSFRPMKYLEKNGDLELIHELAAKGYVTVSTSPQLPDGTQSDQTFLNYVATEKGNAIISELRGSSSK
jgi:hypothetical protein